MSTSIITATSFMVIAHSPILITVAIAITTATSAPVTIPTLLLLLVDYS